VIDLVSVEIGIGQERWMQRSIIIDIASGCVVKPLVPKNEIPIRESEPT